ncbi:hypothetical protein DICPUDRAFT_80916 [Dictyostelium purpureum]|uniref:Bulb-type lectin domain-containing protein n=1 Tax=Dictyostelium purpureum TaxID=5786 RepID=F0ZRX3_DICPU|nr:uncharacterized protein DICPUDRAFT_80916 [Dictyostelium purpureum]EGC33316.1 hypothetical protein DICPUDRAFT_80916 [Dictyostelium purpureum]|eukprot:XP_003290172.1 hypothetical protein DICPUDRAFT_80916 [Dictyostelium purpureum]
MGYVKKQSILFLLGNDAVFNKFQIPLTPGGYWAAGSTFEVGASLSVGSIQLVLKNTGLSLLVDGETVWSPYSFLTPNENALFQFNQDGEFFLFPKSGSPPVWRSNTYSLGGSYINILPSGSYGRQWSIIVQDIDGQMVWGRFGPIVSSDNVIPLIPGSYIDRLNTTINKNFLTNGRYYLSMGLSQNTSEAVGFYHGNPIEVSKSSLWSISKDYQEDSYSLFFTEDSKVCVGIVGEESHKWCTSHNVTANQRYIVVPLEGYENIPNDDGFWYWVVLSSDYNISSIVSSRPLPVFDTKSIPLTFKGSIHSSNGYINVGDSYTVGNTILSMTQDGIQLSHKGQIVWNPFTFSNSDVNAYALFGTDGNFCIKTRLEGWCTSSHNLGGLYLNILPEGSYGREWGIVIQNTQGLMVWGRFGPAINKKGIMPLIPGNFIDRLDPANNVLSTFITNGKNYLYVNKENDALRYLHECSSVWSVNKKSSDSYQLYFQNNSNLCVGEINGSSNSWCNDIINSDQRYVVVPLNNEEMPEENGFWRWVTLNDSKSIVFNITNFIKPVNDLKSIPLTQNGYLQAYSKFGVGHSITVGSIKLQMTSTGLQLLHNNVVVWNPNPTLAANETAFAEFGIDGNLCIRTEKGTCISSHGLGGKYLNVLPYGSYGYKWALIIQNSEGLMVWGRFGPVIDFNSIPLIPGGFIDRLDPTNNKLLVGGRTFITNGRDYLSVNQKTFEAMGIYSNSNPFNKIDGDSIPVWSVNRTNVNINYRLYFKDDSNLCLGDINGPPNTWCNNILSKNQRYVVVVPQNTYLSNNNGFWGIFVMDGNKNITDILSNQREQVFNKNRIPLSINGFIETKQKITTGNIISVDGTLLSKTITVGSIRLQMTNTGLQLLYNNDIVWNPFPLSTLNETAFAEFGQDGNLCIRSKVDWCTASHSLSGKYLNILPDGSYGRKWGIVIQNSEGIMVWGRFGPAISDLGKLPLIPGNYIDRYDSSKRFISEKGFITNGRDYLSMNSRELEALGFYFNYNPNNFILTQDSVWSVNKSSNLNYLLYFNDINDKLCVGEKGKELINTIYCADYFPNQRYVVIPPPLNEYNETFYRWVILNDNNQVVYSLANRIEPIFDQKRIPLTTNGYLKAGDVLKYNQKLVVGKTTLNVRGDGFELSHSGVVVYNPLSVGSEDKNAYLAFGVDGNLCFIHNSKPIFCIYSQTLNGQYLNILPEGSYGREWAIVIQNSAGSMVWGRFGPIISDTGIMPLIPGNFIDRLDPTNNILTNFITNGRDYLSMNSREIEAMGFYYKNNPNNFVTPTSSAWSVGRMDNQNYKLEFSSSAKELCVTAINSDGEYIWCSPTLKENIRYLVVPLQNNQVPQDDLYWRWVLLSDDFTDVFSISQKPPLVFNQLSIPLTKNGNQGRGRFTYLSVGNTELLMTDGLRIRHEGQVVWSLTSNHETSYAQLHVDGNLCITDINGVDLNCTFTQGLGGEYVNILPEGSYGRKWGVVIQNNEGKMVWGRFGPVISQEGNMPLIPGSFIDRLDINNNKISQFITNGYDYLSMNSRESEAVGFYKNNSPKNLVYKTNPSWSISRSETNQRLYFDYINNLCMAPVGKENDPNWCNDIKNRNQRYVIVPLPGSNLLPNDDDFWGWITLFDDKGIAYIASNKRLPVNSLDSIPLSPNGNIETNQTLTVGYKVTIANMILQMTSSGLHLLLNNEVVWSITSPIANGTAFIEFGIDGNLCIRTKEDWCTGSHSLGGKYLNVLPEGSYGRKWAIVIQNSAGKMVWGRFGPIINTDGIMPLIPGSYIDRLDTTNNILTNFITNGRHYLSMNQKPTEAIGLYFDRNPFNKIDYEPSRVWGYVKENSSLNYQFYFKDDSNLCVGSGRSLAPVWCNNKLVNGRYLVLPIDSFGYPIETVAIWLLLDSDKGVVDHRSNINLPVYDKDSIPLTPNGHIVASNSNLLTVNYNIKVDDTVLSFTNRGFKLYYKNEEVWSPYNFSPSSSLVAFLKTDGNLCVKLSANDQLSTWCTLSNGFGGQYLNILPGGSYGRKWGIVIQNTQGLMVWGRFGPAISTIGIMPLIPGNYIDRMGLYTSLNSTKNFITNGRDYLMASHGDFAMGLYIDTNPHLYPNNKTWYFSKPTPTSTYNVIIQSDTNVCINDINTNTNIWCNMEHGQSQRYIVMPLPNDEQGGWVTLNDNMELVYSRVVFIHSSIYTDGKTQPYLLPAQGLKNSFTSLSYNPGTLIFTNLLNNKQLKSYVSSQETLLKPNFNGYGYSIISKNYFSFFAEYADCGILNCLCKNTYFSLRGTPETLDRGDATFIGFNSLVPELLLVTSSGESLSNTKFYNISHYYPKYYI